MRSAPAIEEAGDFGGEEPDPFFVIPKLISNDNKTDRAARAKIPMCEMGGPQTWSLEAMTRPAAWIIPALVRASDIGIRSDPDAALIESMTVAGSLPSSS